MTLWAAAIGYRLSDIAVTQAFEQLTRPIRRMRKKMFNMKKLPRDSLLSAAQLNN